MKLLFLDERDIWRVYAKDWKSFPRDLLHNRLAFQLVIIPKKKKRKHTRAGGGRRIKGKKKMRIVME